MGDAGREAVAYFHGYLAEKKALIDEALNRYLARYPSPLGEMMIYSAEGGKRLRGTVVLSAAEYFGEGRPDRPAGTTEDALDLAVAVELVHAYSLVHDDLPCMDNDDFRRGKPTTHRKFGEAMAVLTGDALLTAAFEVGLGKPSLSPVRQSRRARACMELSRGAGAAGMVAGQVLDMQAKGKRLGCEAVRRVYMLKTAALFESAAKIGGIVAAADEKHLEILGAWGREFGYAFQIADDIEDSYSALPADDDTLVLETSIQDAAGEAVLALRKSQDYLAALRGPGENWFLPELSRFYLNRLGTLVNPSSEENEENESR